MTLFLIGLLVFLGIHSISIVAPGWRDRVVAKHGKVPWQAIYALISLGSFIALIIGYGEARGTSPVLYTPPTGLRHFAMLLMLPVFPLLLAAYLPGRIKAWVHHPMLWAVILWGTAHLMANGSLVDVLLFGGFALWAALDIFSFRYRQVRPLQPALKSKWNDLIAIVLGLVIYGALVGGLHLWLFGVAPVPMG